MKPTKEQKEAILKGIYPLDSETVEKMNEEAFFEEGSGDVYDKDEVIKAIEEGVKLGQDTMEKKVTAHYQGVCDKLNKENSDLKDELGKWKTLYGDNHYEKQLAEERKKADKVANKVEALSKFVYSTQFKNKCKDLANEIRSRKKGSETKVIIPSQKDHYNITKKEGDKFTCPRCGESMSCPHCMGGIGT